MYDLTTKRERKMQETINRISNVMIGNHRIWNLERIAMEMEADADMYEERQDEGVDAEGLRRDALFLRRLEWDLGVLHEVVRGDTARRSGRYTEDNWKGARP